ncbi:CCCH-type zinc finger transcription factor [Phycomyces blakesleeanus]|uniref:CCCH-type zinc finger transcription factor n=2 Tax=Phycomyces blakesleeanus TaxID=4837 RepID=A0A167R6G4_PHYB8|nr:CCCH-type zinc finger transcription factor [Phycomyces blakesleeanus NRRL 1555(-)]OAD80959.1 CCCH-type zinc finger transcription factor [Phycomyces blakesleeanus NRRL 1555(-)]|eukprot:XP_018298999.1 CCCH-type zinc finger transcription factor [Phycomyces blakesleeanus NRRL 1555(-)]
MSNRQQPSDLKAFLCKEVESICDAEPDVLANFVMTIIGEKEIDNALRQSLEKNLRDFLDDQTGPFIDRLFDKLNENNRPVEILSAAIEDPLNISSRRLSDFSDDEDDGDRNFKHRRQRQEDQEDSYTTRQVEERGKRRFPENNQAGGMNKHSRVDDSRRGPDGIPMGPAAMYNNTVQQSTFDGRGRGRGNRGNRGGMNMGRTQRPRCRDYNEKGFCMRGDMCPYDHGVDRIIVDEGFNGPFPNGPGHMGAMSGRGPQPPFFGMPNTMVPNGMGPDAYDPERATLMPNGNMPFPTDMSSMLIPETIPPIQMSQPTRGTARGGMRGRGRGRGSYMGGSSGGYQQQLHSKSGTTLVVENIPPEECQITKVHDFFQKFGTLTNISVQPHQQKAILQYGTRAEAEAAYHSPDAIFDNRFVKVYWQREKEDGSQQPQQQQQQQQQASSAEAQAAALAASIAANEPDPELVAARAAELAKQREEKLKKHQERMQAVLDAQKQKEQLLQKQIDEQKQLMEKLGNKDMSRTEKEELLKSLKKIGADINASRSGVATAASAPQTQATSTTTTTTTSTATASATAVSGTPETPEDLKKKLAILEAEAAALGLAAYGPSFRGGRGGYFGRGRGYPRMRGGMTRMSLDNRPTKLLIKDIPEDTAEEVQKHFEQYGTVTSYESSEQGVIVQYSQRFEAEKAMSVGANFPKGTLQLSWFTESSSGAPSTTDNSTESNQSSTEANPAQS